MSSNIQKKDLTQEKYANIKEHSDKKILKLIYQKQELPMAPYEISKQVDRFKSITSDENSLSLPNIFLRFKNLMSSLAKVIIQ